MGCFWPYNYYPDYRLVSSPFDQKSEVDRGGNRSWGQFVTETDIDYYEVIRRGGFNCGDENFAFIRCPSCGHIYLTDYEVDTAYLDANDLSRRVGFFSPSDIVVCIACKEPLQAERIWAALRGEAGTQDWQVTWESFLQSAWAWAAKQDKTSQPT